MLARMIAVVLLLTTVLMSDLVDAQQEADHYKPFVLASRGAADFDARVQETRDALTGAATRYHAAVATIDFANTWVSWRQGCRDRPVSQGIEPHPTIRGDSGIAQGIDKCTVCRRIVGTGQSQFLHVAVP